MRAIIAWGTNVKFLEGFSRYGQLPALPFHPWIHLNWFIVKCTNEDEYDANGTCVTAHV